MMARKKSRKRNQGRRYEAGEWVQFVLHGLAGRDVEVTPELKEAAVNFEAAVEEAVATCIRKYPPKGGVQATIDELRDEGANTIYDVYATLAGEGVGIWDGRWDAYYPNADRQHWQKLANCLRKELSRQYGALESAFVDAAFAEQDNPSRTKNPSWKFSDDPEDVQWIRETFIPSLPDNVQSYILFGNEDYPEKISVFAEKSPTIYSTGTIYRPDKSGRYKKAGTERNPLKDMPGGSVSGCIAAQKRKKKGKRPRDPGAYCAAIADRIEPGWRTKNPKSSSIPILGTGDRDSLTYGGGVLYYEPEFDELTWVFWDEPLEEDLKKATYQVRSFTYSPEEDVLKGQLDWMASDLDEVADSYGITKSEIRDLARGASVGRAKDEADVLHKWRVAEMAAQYWGADNIDSYPNEYSHKEMKKRFGRDTDAVAGRSFEQAKRIYEQARKGRNPGRGRNPTPGNPYQGDAVELAKYRKSREEWERKGKKGPPPLQPEARGTRRAARNTKAGRAAHRLSNP